MTDRQHSAKIQMTEPNAEEWRIFYTGGLLYSTSRFLKFFSGPISSLDAVWFHGVPSSSLSIFLTLKPTRSQVREKGRQTHQDGLTHTLSLSHRRPVSVESLCGFQWRGCLGSSCLEAQERKRVDSWQLGLSWMSFLGNRYTAPCFWSVQVNWTWVVYLLPAFLSSPRLPFFPFSHRCC